MLLLAQWPLTITVNSECVTGLTPTEPPTWADTESRVRLRCPTLQISDGALCRHVSLRTTLRSLALSGCAGVTDTGVTSLSGSRPPHLPRGAARTTPQNVG